MSATAMTTRQSRCTALVCALLALWEVLASLALAYALPGLARFGLLAWFGGYSVRPNPYLGVLQYLAPLLHFHALSRTTWRALELAAAIGAAGVLAVIAIMIRLATLARFRRRFVRWPWQSEDDSPRPLERGISDNHGHARMADEAWLLREFPPPRRDDTGIKVVGFAGRRLLFDDYSERSRVTLEFSGTRSGKTASLISTIAYWARAGLPQVILDPSCEIGPMMWRLLALELECEVRILNADPDPRDGNGDPAPWRHLIACYDALGWIDVNDPYASANVQTMASYFVEVENARPTENEVFFRDSARDLIACIIAHILWHDGPDAPPKTLETVRAVLSLGDTELRCYLTRVHYESNSSMARQLAGGYFELDGRAEETFGNISFTARLATSWLSNPQLCAMVSGDDFSANDITEKRPVAVIIQVPMHVMLAHKGIARVVFGSFFTAKIAARNMNDALFVPDECWLLGKTEAHKTALFAGGKHGIVMHMPWQSLGQMEDVWGRDGRRFWLDNAAYVMFGRLRDPQVAKEVSDAMGTMAVVAVSEGDNKGMQAGIGFGRFSRGRTVNRHEIKRPVRMLSEIISDLERDDLLLIGLARPAQIKRALWFRIPWLAAAIDPSPYARQDEMEEEEAA
jgi:type IV secretion system protein VirD4